MIEYYIRLRTSCIEEQIFYYFHSGLLSSKKQTNFLLIVHYPRSIAAKYRRSNPTWPAGDAAGAALNLALFIKLLRAVARLDLHTCQRRT